MIVSLHVPQGKNRKTGIGRDGILLLLSMAPAWWLMPLCFVTVFLSVSWSRVELKIHQGFVGSYPKSTCFHQTHIWQHGFACMCICFYWHVSPAFVYISIYLCMWAPASKHICLLSGTRFNVFLGGPFVSCHEDPKTVWLTQFSSNFNINHSRVQ